MKASVGSACSKSIRYQDGMLKETKQKGNQKGIILTARKRRRDNLCVMMVFRRATFLSVNSSAIKPTIACTHRYEYERIA